MKTGTLVSAVLLACCSWPRLLPAQQAGPSLPSSVAAASETYPDQGYLSPTRYTNCFFGFTFEFPVEARLQPQSRPVAADGHPQLLDLAGPAPAHAQVSISAYAVRGKGEIDAKRLLRKQLDEELFYGVEELRGLSKATIDKHLFYIYVTRRGVDEHAILTSDLNGQVLEVVVAARDDVVLKQLLGAFQATRFFDPAQAWKYAGSDAKPYEGPAMSAHRLAQLLADPPKDHLAAGSFVGDQYRNSDLGLVYQLPASWHISSEPGIEAAVARAHPPVKFNLDGMGDPWMGRSERDLLSACNRTLFSAWKSKPAEDGELRYEDFGEITLSAMSLACFPDLNFPANITDPSEIRSFLRQFRLTHPLLDEMRDAKAFQSSGYVFVLMQGVIALQNKEDALSRRISVAYAVTHHEDYLLIWLFAAPHDSELRELMSANMTLAPEAARNPKTQVAAGGGQTAPAGANGNMTSSTTTQTAITQVSTAKPPVADGGSSTAQTAPQDPKSSPPSSSQAAAESTSEPPSLLRPGETMKDQQMKGTPVPQKH